MKSRAVHTLSYLQSLVLLTLHLWNYKVGANYVTGSAPILEVEVSQIRKIVEMRPFRGYSNRTFTEFFIRINTVMDEDDNSVLSVLNDTVRYIAHVNKQQILSQDIYLIVSIVPGIKNMSNYLANLDEIGRITMLSRGIVAQVLLDFSNIEVGPLDRSEIINRWKSCNQRGQMGKFGCGFIFDGRMCPDKVSLFKLLSAYTGGRFVVVFNIRMFPHDDTYEVKLKMLLSTCGSATINSDLYFLGFMDSSIVQINPTDISIAYFTTAVIGTNTQTTLRFIQTARLSQKSPLELETIHSNMTKFSDLSGNMSTSLIVSIQPKALHQLLSSPIPIALSVDGRTRQEFLEMFHMFLVQFKGGDTDSISKVFSSVMDYRSKRIYTYHFRPVVIFIAFTPTMNIEEELLTLLQDIKRVNLKQFNAVPMIYLDYNDFRVTPGFISVIKSDMRLCEVLERNFSIPFGFIFHERNCIPSYKEFLSIFPKESYILFRGAQTYLSECYNSFPYLNIGQIKAVEFESISINFSSSTFRYEPADILNAQVHRIMQVLTVSIDDEDDGQDTNLEGTDTHFATEEWFHSQNSLSNQNVGFSVRILDFQLIRELKAFPVVVIDATGSNLLYRIAAPGVESNYTHRPLCIPKKENIPQRVMISFALVNSDPEHAKERVAAFVKGMELVGNECRSNFHDIVFDWGMCFDNESCEGRDIDEYTSTHFDVISSVIKHTSALYRNTVTKISIIVPLLLLPELVNFFGYRAVRPVEPWRLREQHISWAENIAKHINFSQLNATFSSVDGVIISDAISVDFILTEGPHRAFKWTIKWFEMSLYQLDILKRGQQQHLESTLKLTIYGCNKLSSLTSELKFIRYWEILSNWADKMDKLLIMDSTKKDPSNNETKCSEVFEYTKPMQRKCGCGWWIYDQGARRYVNRKAVALTKHQRTRISFKGTPALNLVMLVPVVLIAVSVALAFFMTMAYLCRRSRRKALVPEIIRKASENLKHRKIARDELSTSDVIGRGESGTTIFKGSYQPQSGNAVEVAVKVWKAPSGMKLQNIDFFSLRNVISEANILDEVGEHPNIIKFFGLCTSSVLEVQLVLEFCPLGSLLCYLREHRVYASLDANNQDVESSLLQLNRAEWVFKMTKWTLDVTSGLEYLSSKNIVHADIAARNILLDQTMVCKLADFGMSRKLDSSQIYMKEGQEPLPWRWMAPESLQLMKFNEKTDVWMFGIAVWEIFTFGEVPFGGFTWSSEFTGMLQRGLQPELPKSMYQDMATLLKSCWSINCNERPTFALAKRLLISILTRLNN